MYRGKLRGKRGAKGLKSKVAKLQRSVARLKVNRELKEHYTAISTMTPSASTGSGFQIQHVLCDVLEGDDYNQRTGRKIVPQGLDIRLRMLGTPSAGGLYTLPRVVRVILFQDMGYNGTAITGSQLLQTYSTTSDVMSTAISPINTDYVKSKNVPDGRIHILYDKNCWIHPQLSFYSSECSKEFNIKIPAKKLKELYFNGAGTNSFVGGTIFMYLCLGQAQAAADNAQFAYISKLTYWDE